MISVDNQSDNFEESNRKIQKIINITCQVIFEPMSNEATNDYQGEVAGNDYECDLERF